MKKYYPVLFDIEGKTVLVAGGGRVAYRKAKDLCEAGAFVKIVSPQISSDISEFADRFASVEIIRREYKTEDICGAVLVFAATDDNSVNRRIRQDANNENIPVNAADDTEGSSFTVPSFTRRGDLVLALSTGGKSPAYAAKLRREIESLIPDNAELILDALYEARNILIDDSDFNYNSDERGAILRAIVSDEEALSDLSSSYKTPDFKQKLKRICMKILSSFQE